jgi:transcription initiation factor IIE alpha subunit
MTELTCPKCGDELKIDDSWQIIDPSKIGTKAGDVQGEYAHEEYLDRPMKASAYYE